MNEEQLLARLDQRLPDWRPSGPPEPLRGGLLNLIWRVPGWPRSVVVKHAPPHIAAAPEVPLDPGRLTFEARALSLLAPEGPLAELASAKARPPRPIDFDAEATLLVMEDLGRLPHLGESWTLPSDQLRERAHDLGELIGRLHGETRATPRLAQEFTNEPIQRTRHEVQYLGIGPRLRDAEIDAWERPGARAVDLGQRLQQPGRCLIMGDLWPPSVLLAGDGLRLIDWEFVHYGQPAQDLGHLAAHLWMHRHRAPVARVAHAVRGFWCTFLEGYATGAHAALPHLLDARSAEDISLHAGAEIIARTLGPFGEGYLYDGTCHGAEARREAVAAAVELLDPPDRVDLESLV